MIFTKAGAEEGIVVPDVVVRDLVMPDLLARFEIEADDGIGEQIAAQAMTSIIVVGGRLNGEISVSKFWIDRDRRPHTSIACIAVGVLLPRLAPGSPFFGTV